jgi:dTDP-4-amino-4,6-dideoxygalactose transaminase
MATGLAAHTKLAVLGGTPVRKERFPSWPKFDAAEEKALLDVLRSGRWGRGSGSTTEQFESRYATLLGSRHCLATANGTSALITAMNGIAVAPGDEVIVPPYTFVATINVVLLQHALPVFVDTDIDSFQIDARRIEAAITPRTKAIVPVHLGGGAADLDAILTLARKHNLPVVEDACQSHLAEWRGKRVGTHGTAGCFSFQASKNLNSGEGGAMVTDDEALVERCYTFHNNGRGRKNDPSNFRYSQSGANLRLTEFQAALLLAQMTRLEEQSRTREENAAYLTEQLRQIPGITPARAPAGCTRNAYHLYMFRYDREKFSAAPRKAFLRALQAEGVPASGGYAPLNQEPFLASAVRSRAYKALFPAKVLSEWEEKNRCPQNDRLCEEAVWFTQTMLLGPRRDMDQIAEAIRKIQEHSSELPKVQS